MAVRATGLTFLSTFNAERVSMHSGGLVFKVLSGV